MVFFVIYLKYLVIRKQTLIICLHEYKKKKSTKNAGTCRNHCSLGNHTILNRGTYLYYIRVRIWTYFTDLPEARHHILAKVNIM